MIVKAGFGQEESIHDKLFGQSLVWLAFVAFYVVQCSAVLAFYDVTVIAILSLWVLCWETNSPSVTCSVSM